MTWAFAPSLLNRVESCLRDRHVSPASNGSEKPSRDIMKQRPGLGIMVLSSVRTVLYANRTAYHFLKVLHCRENSQATDGTLPVVIADFFDQVLQLLEDRITHHDYEPFEVRRLFVGMGKNRSLLVRAFGLPDRLGTQRSRVVVTMQEVIRPLDDRIERGHTLMLA